MDAWLIRLAERGGRRYFIVAFVASNVIAACFIGPGISAVPSHYLGLSVGEYLQVIALVEGLLIVLSLIGFYRARHHLALIYRWLGPRPSEGRDEVWVAIFELPWLVVRTMFIVSVPLATPLTTIALVDLSGYDTTQDYVGIAIGALTSFAAAGAAGAYIVETLCRPTRVLLGAFEEIPVRGGRIGRRLVMAMIAGTVYGGAAVGFLATDRADAGPDYLLQVYAIALGSGLLVAALFGPMQVSLLGPIRDLRKGTQDVAEGRLDTHVPITTSDELGGLALAFNEMIEDLRASRARIVGAGNEARRRVERDLHDGAQQQLVLLGLKLHQVERALTNDPDRAAILLADARADLDHALLQLRDLARGIYPASLTDEGLPGALNEAVLRAGIPASLTIDAVRRYPPDVETAVYFCCIEALQNAAKHGGEGTRATVTLRNGDAELLFSVADDGVGFDTRVEGAGLRNMDDRLGALGGRVTVSSARGAGTTVMGRIPL